MKTNLGLHPLHFSIYTRSCARAIFKMVTRRKGRNLLDVGCGIGYYLERLKEVAPDLKTYGMDYDMASLQFISKMMKGGFVRGDGARLPFMDNGFDKVLSVSVLEHLEDDGTLVGEMARVCKNGGELIVSVPSKDGIRSFSKLRNLGHDDPTNPEYHYRIGYSKNELVSLLEKHGVEVQRVEYSLVLTAELIMDAVKFVYFKKNTLHSQADIQQAADSPLFRIYKFFFPLIALIELIEQYLLSPFLKGHIINVYGRVRK